MKPTTFTVLSPLSHSCSFWRIPSAKQPRAFLRTWSKIGHGTYRLPPSEQGEAILTKSLNSGLVNVLDTSSNYSDGEAEIVIGDVLEKTKKRGEVDIITKFGCIQGSALERYHATPEEHRPPETTPFMEDCYHSIHPHFMVDQLKRSLERLRTRSIDVYLIHNPEYYLVNSVKAKEQAKEHQEILLKRIHSTIEALEAQVKLGSIKSYGISSNSFSLSSDNLHFLPYEPLLDCAVRAAQRIGNDQHSFKVVELPGNLLEKEGLQTCATWASKHGLRVLINRPLNAIHGGQLLKMADYPKPPYFRQVVNHTMDYFEERMKETDDLAAKMASQNIQRFVMDLDQKVNLFESIFHFEHNLRHSIYPSLLKIGEKLFDDPKRGQEDMKQLQVFLDEYLLQVQHFASVSVRNKLLDLNAISNNQIPTQHQALQFLLSQPAVTTVLLGMTKEEYVDDTIAFLKQQQ